MKRVAKRLLHFGLNGNYVSNTFLAILSVILSSLIVMNNYAPTTSNEGGQHSITVEQGQSYVTLTPDAPAGNNNLASNEFSGAAIVVSASQVDYDSFSDAMGFAVHLQRLGGYNQAVTSVTAYDTDSGVTFECHARAVDANTYALACGYINGPRPTVGTMQVNVYTAGDMFYAYTGFSLPPQ